MNNSVVALNGIIGAQESCLALLPHGVYCQDLLQDTFWAIAFLLASVLFIVQSPQFFIMLHEFSSIPFVIHIVSSIHQADGSHFVWQQHVLGMKQSAIGFQASGANPYCRGTSLRVKSSSAQVVSKEATM
jgi:hypothetical protein